jgi:cytidine deaminase
LTDQHHPRPTLDREAARALLVRAREARANAYAPYSDFPVGAALLAADGRVFTGANVENASYGLGNCAERVAVGRAVSEGAREFIAIAVVGPREDLGCTPCGACRQVLYEFGPEMLVITTGCQGEPDGVHVSRVSEMLPGAFGPESLRGGPA